MDFQRTILTLELVVSIDAENGEGRRAQDCFKPDLLHLACQSSSPDSLLDEIALLREPSCDWIGRRREKFPS